MIRVMVAMCVTFLCALPAFADDGQLIGVWKLQTFEVELQDTGEHKTPLGANPSGYGIFTAEGRTMAILTAENRNVPQSDIDMVAAFRSMVAYSGIYRLEEDRWITKVDIAWNEGWKGTEQVRFYRIEGDTLTVATPWTASRFYDGRMGRSITTWHKVQ